ncbi:Hypothetical protein MVR_LOCUS21 [uncultured virus]|nr:Hypothetical protein MVR_LOCUS21 [uncultured virus]
MSRRSKYSHDQIKFFGASIENLKDPNDYQAIFDILLRDPASFCGENSKGSYANLSAVNDTTLGRIKRYLEKVSASRDNEIGVDNDVIPISDAQQPDRSYKRSNYEKNILKQRKLKKLQNEDDEYEELTFERKAGSRTSKAASSKSSPPAKQTTKAKPVSKPKVTTRKASRSED